MCAVPTEVKRKCQPPGAGVKMEVCWEQDLWPLSKRPVPLTTSSSPQALFLGSASVQWVISLIFIT